MVELHSIKTQEAVLKITRDAGEIAKKYFHSGDFTSHSKGGSDFATQADLEIDNFLNDRLTKAFPETTYLGEETAPDDLSKLHAVENLWVVDPIDGTTNFSRGDSHFAISVALVDRGKTKLAVVYLPMEDRLYTALADQENAYCNDTILAVSEITKLQTASVAYDWSWDVKARVKTHNWVSKFAMVVRQPRALGSAASDVAKVAKGELDAYVISGVKPWDVAAASLLVEKAGGNITTPQGSEWNIFIPDILATNGKLHGDILALLAS